MKFTIETRIDIGSSTTALALSRDGAQVSVTSFDQKLRAYDTAGMKHLKTVHLGTSFPHAVCYSPDGRTVASGGKALTLFDTSTWKKRASLKGHSHEIQDATFSADGSRAFTASGNGYTPADWSVRAWDAATGAQLWRYKGPQQLYCVAASHDGRLVAAGDANGLVTIHDASNGDVKTTASAGAWTYEAHFTPDDREVIFVGDFDGLRAVNVANGAVREIATGCSARSIALTADAKRAFVGSTEYGNPVPLRVVDITRGEVVAEGPALGRLPQGVALSPDERRLYVLMNEPNELVVIALA